MWAPLWGKHLAGEAERLARQVRGWRGWCCWGSLAHDDERRDQLRCRQLGHRGRGDLGYGRGERCGRQLGHRGRGRLRHRGRGLRRLVADVSIVVVRRGTGATAEDDDAGDDGRYGQDTHQGSLLGHFLALPLLGRDLADLPEPYKNNIKL